MMMMKMMMIKLSPLKIKQAFLCVQMRKMKICALLAEIAVATVGAAAVVTLFSSYGLNGLR